MLPIAETFTSIHGEGQYAGTPMHFIRLAGCSVGKGGYPFTCTAWNGIQFECDTDYRKQHDASIATIMSEIPKSIRHVCITGGEPMMHKETPELVRDLCERNIMPHIETSGTIEIPLNWPDDLVYITVAPKSGYLPSVLHRADEIKILIGAKILPQCILKTFKPWMDKVWLQPINDYDKLNFKNVERCIALIKEEPRFRLSLQIHKVIGVR